eukprot:TRINITY_DN3958_c0_g1_i1.p1 TRINITY_DN3958_c0_g1~~TRINITY_DN3958_c0_g1_i1.p1  ORF type:complete len:197 (-),score=37.83 TRINITY_DN3958_c0_g1_i1:19-609(-)
MAVEETETCASPSSPPSESYKSRRTRKRHSSSPPRPSLSDTPTTPTSTTSTTTTTTTTTTNTLPQEPTCNNFPAACFEHVFSQTSTFQHNPLLKNSSEIQNTSESSTKPFCEASSSFSVNLLLSSTIEQLSLSPSKHPRKRLRTDSYKHKHAEEADESTYKEDEDENFNDEYGNEVCFLLDNFQMKNRSSFMPYIM